MKITPHHIRVTVDVKNNRLKYYLMISNACCPYIGSTSVGPNGELIKSKSLIAFLRNPTFKWR